MSLARTALEIEDPIAAFAAAWLETGLPLPVAAVTSHLQCHHPKCSALPFVSISTALGSRRLCLCHFQAVQTRVRYLSGASAGSRQERGGS